MSKRSSSQLSQIDESSYEESSDYTYDASDAQSYFSSQENVVDAYDLAWHAMTDQERMTEINTARGFHGVHARIEFDVNNLF